MDRWGQLNLQQKNQLLGIYASKGYTDLASIISHYNSYAEGGTVDGPDEPNFVGGATSVNPNYKVWEDLADRYPIEANKPSWHQGLTNYDWARAKQYYSNPDGTLTNQGIEFLKNVSSKRITGQSNFIRDVNKLSYIPNAAVGAIGAMPAIAGLMATTTIPVVDAILTTYGVISAPKNIEKGVKNIKEGNILEGVGDLGSTALDVLGFGQLATRGSRMLSRGYRAKHAYNTISPVQYRTGTNVGQTLKANKDRLSDYAKSMWYNYPVDINNPLWLQKAKSKAIKENRTASTDYWGYTGTGNYIGKIGDNIKHRGVLADKARMDALAIYTGQTPPNNIYIKNSDGSYRYNMEAISDITEGTWYPYYKKLPTEQKQSMTDFVTGAGGGLTDYRLKKDYIQDKVIIEDLWDLNPFRNIKKAPKFVRDLEVGKFFGGKPFLMHTEIPYGESHIKTEDLLQFLKP